MKLTARIATCSLVAASFFLGRIDSAVAVVLPASDAFMSMYHAPRVGGVGQPETRASAFTVLTNGVVDHGGGPLVDNIDTFNFDDTGVTLDFVGLQYASPNRFDSLTVELGNQFSD